MKGHFFSHLSPGISFIVNVPYKILPLLPGVFETFQNKTKNKTNENKIRRPDFEEKRGIWPFWGTFRITFTSEPWHLKPNQTERLAHFEIRHGGCSSHNALLPAFFWDLSVTRENLGIVAEINGGKMSKTWDDEVRLVHNLWDCPYSIIVIFSIF